MAARITVIITCKDERTNIGPCIDSAWRLADEVLVADSGSTDGTLEYVRRRGDCRVIEREYVTAGDFRNWAIPQASHEWVMILDSDERITPELAVEMRRSVERDLPYDGYRMTRTNHLMGYRVRHTDWSRDRILRFFRKEVTHYEGPSDHGDAVVSTGRVGTLREPLVHYTLWTWGQYLKKFDRYTQLQAEQWHAAGRRPSYLRMLFQPGLRFFRDYVIHLGFLDGAIGLQIAMMSAIYSFTKQARLWELHHKKKQADVEGAAMAAAERKAA